MRNSIRETGYLEKVMNSLDPGVSEMEFSKQALRVIGNCCIGEEESQILVVKHLSKLGRALEYDELFEVAAGAISNLYSSDIASPDEAVEIGLVEKIATKLVLPEKTIITSESPVVPAVVSFLSSVVETTLESGVLQLCATKEFFQAMLQLPTEKPLDDDTKEDSVGAALLILKDEAMQQKIMTIHETYNEKPPPDVSDPNIGYDVDPWLLSMLLYYDIQAKADIADEVDTQRIKFLEATLCDMACLIKYPSTRELTNDFTLSCMLQWAGTRKPKGKGIATNSRLKAQAFLIMGNIARRRDICETLVHKFSFHLDAIYLIKQCDPNEKAEPSDAAVRHAAAGFLRNLANAPENKQAIRESEVVRYLLHSVDGEAQTDGFKLLRVLVRDEPEACSMILSPDNGYRAHLGITMKLITNTLPTLEPGGEDENAESKLEIGRLLVAVLKTVQQNQLTLGSYDFMNETLVGAILALIQNAAGTVIASEGWLGLALASVNVEGAKLVYQALRVENPPFNSLNKTFQSSVDTGDQMEKLKDAENALVVVGQLVKNLVSCLQSQ
jgi:hypothetical protein